MEFRVLGPLEVFEEGRRVDVGPAKPRALLTLLLLHAGESLSVDRIIDELWEGDPPATAVKSVHVHVSRLRRTLGPRIVTREHGYALQVEPAAIDARRFEQGVAVARSSLAAGHPGEADAAFAEALALWRGPPLADLAHLPFVREEADRLEALRVAALEQSVDAKLALGAHADVLPTLEALVGEHPYRERLRAQLMLALYRCDRQADALQAYQDTRQTLVDALGIEPGERLRELEAAILAHDPSLDLAAPEPVAIPTGVVTFLLTDIEGSSGMWDREPQGMAIALEEHDGIIARTVDDHGGHLLKTKGEGDSTFTVFRRASDALAAAVALQRALDAAPWPGELVLRVRVALHTGEAHERDGDFFGPAVNRAARLRSLAAGGAVVLSQVTAGIVRDTMPRGATLVAAGARQLRGMARPEHVFEVRLSADGAALRRKTVSVLFADVVDADAGLDPEARARGASRALDAARAVLGRHGGTVEPCPGDALVAIFGVPALHEDDAERAVRAAAELRGDGVRIGVATGEVVAGPGRPLSGGGAATAARRLAALAGDGDALVDEATHRLVRDLVDVEPAAGGLRLAGRPRAPAARVLRRDAPLVGRDRHVDRLAALVATAVADRGCHLVTVLGPAGVGKSRLVDELLDGLGDEVTVLRGRCLPYGDGITYWPLAEIVRGVAGEATPGALAAALGDDPRAGAIAAGVADALGLGSGDGVTSEEIFRAVRAMLEVLADRRPAVVVVDDVHWAEPTFLDLLEHVADLSRGVPLVLLCVARPELLDVRPGWAGGKVNATSILLEPLAAAETARLVGALADAIAPADAQRIADASEGYPLFVEELVAMLREDGLLTGAAERGELPVPPTIHALLAARLERLPEDERELLARGSVEGAVFHRGTIEALAPAPLAPSVDRALSELVRRDLIRAERPTFAGDDAYRFRHMLIRDAAYRSLPKETRAGLHERVAGWLVDAVGPGQPELEEIVGYHLEQAHRYRAELGVADDALAGLASSHLELAGRRALGRSDRTAAVTLLERAAALVPGDEARLARLLPGLGATLIELGRLDAAGATLGAAEAAARAARDEPAAARTRCQGQLLRLQRGEPDDAAGVATDAMAVFTRAGDHEGLCLAHRLRAWSHWIEARAGAAAAAWEEAADHARRAGAEHQRVEILGWLASSQFFGPTPAADGIVRCEAIRAEVGRNLEALAGVLDALAGLHAMQGRFDAARAAIADGAAARAEHGITLHTAVSHHAAIVELLAGDPAAAERSLRAGFAALEAMGERAQRSTTAAFLGQALFAQGRHEEAERLAATSADLATDDDVLTQALWRGVRARALAARGRTTEAEELARDAVALARRTDFVNHEGDAVADLAAVLHDGGRPAAAREATAEALALYERKGNVVAAERARTRLVALARV